MLPYRSYRTGRVLLGTGHGQGRFGDRETLRRLHVGRGIGGRGQRWNGEGIGIL